jgi:hypothetical protein
MMFAEKTTVSSDKQSKLELLSKKYELLIMKACGMLI